MQGEPEGRKLALLRHAAADLRESEALEECPVCRANKTGLRILAEEEVLAERVSDHLAHAGLTSFRVRMMALGERIGVFSVLARLLLKVRGLPR